MSRPASYAASDFLVQPMAWAAHLTWLAVAIDLALAGFAGRNAGPVFNVACFALFVTSLFLHMGTRSALHWCWLLVSVQTLAVLALVWGSGRHSTPILLILIAAQWASISTRTAPAILWLIATNLGLFAVIGGFSGHVDAAISVAMLMGFQGFALLSARYAKQAEDRAESLRAINAELLATRGLLEDSARDRERLRLSRELHDVAGHKLTALKLNLRALQRAAASNQPELQQCADLADELLGDLRGVVRQMQADEGIDMRRALLALARPFPGVEFHIRIDDGVRIEEFDAAHAIIRVCQEAITNAIRHGDARRIDIALSHREERLELVICDQGRGGRLNGEGTGIAGMRSRAQEAGGELRLDPASGGWRVSMSLPA